MFDYVKYRTHVESFESFLVKMLFGVRVSPLTLLLIEVDPRPV